MLGSPTKLLGTRPPSGRLNFAPIGSFIAGEKRKEPASPMHEQQKEESYKTY